MQFQKFCKNMICSLLVCFLTAGMALESSANAQFNSPYFAEESFVLQDEQLVPCSADLDDSFKDDTILVSLKHKDSEVNKPYSPEDFPEIQAVSVEDLTYTVGGEDNDLIRKEKFHQILSIQIKNTGKSNVLDAIEKLEARKDVHAVSPDYHEYVAYDELPMPTAEEAAQAVAAATNDPRYKDQWNLAKVDAAGAWNITRGSDTVKVGIMENGVANHVDLTSNLSFSSAGTEQEHGTNVAGVLGAVGNNNTGISGVAQKVKIVLLNRSLGDAITYARNNGIKIINGSFRYVKASGSDENADYNQVHKDLIDGFNGLFVFSAGNQTHNNDGSKPQYPASYTSDNIISVASTTDSDTLSDFSNYGATSVDLAAPGSSILTTGLNNQYVYSNGTSFSAPMVAGVAALIESKYRGMTPQQIRQIIINSVDKVPALNGRVASGGRLNARKALEAARDYQSMALAGDFNGDGKDDVVELSGLGSAGSQFVVRLSTGSSFEAPKTWFQSPQVYMNEYFGRAAAGDFNGDGKDDIAILYYYANKSTKLLVYLSNGSSFHGQTWQSWAPNMFQADKVTGRFAAGDVNGDGKDDIVTMYDYGNSKTKIFAHISNGKSFTGSTEFQSWDTGMYNANSVTGRFACGDVNGDGKDDLTVMYDYGNNAKIFTYLSSGTKFSSSQEWWSNAYYGPSCITNRFAMGDLNGDGKDDLAVMYYYPDKRTNIYTYLSTGSKFDGSKNWRSWPADYYPANNVSYKFTMGDFNKDGKDDIVTLFHYSDYRSDGNNHLHTFISTGNGLNQSTWSTK